MSAPINNGGPERVLRLTLKKRWFDMIASGEKREEYRAPSQWIKSRLVGKAYDLVEFSNGYSKSDPKMTVEYQGWHMGYGRAEWGGATKPGEMLVVIRLGRVLSHQNKAREGKL